MLNWYCCCYYYYSGYYYYYCCYYHHVLEIEERDLLDLEPVGYNETIRFTALGVVRIITIAILLGLDGRMI